ncbi:ABC transporter ATP-binding protein [Pseudooceanicola sp.]|uniref:ABC transporter ATP-binding protein n=1 Tax=Pseudooceanicola sp. TaxID=1914328 RepID=UPI0035176FB0
MTAIVKLEDVSIRFGSETIYDRLSFKVQDGEFLCILGPSGCGKSTLLRVIGDLLKVDSGTVTVNDKLAENAWQDIAYVFQAPRLLPWRSAEGNVIAGQQLRFGRDRSKAEMKAKAQELLDLVGLSRDLHKMPQMLSGGERQRVSIARALAVDPKIILMDEPFSALDIATRRRMRAEVTDLWRKTGKTVIFVTHEIEEALELADRIVLLTRKPTTVQRIIELDQQRPRDLNGPELDRIRADLHATIGTDAEDDPGVASSK